MNSKLQDFYCYILEHCSLSGPLPCGPLHSVLHNIIVVPHEDLQFMLEIFIQIFVQIFIKIQVIWIKQMDHAINFFPPCGTKWYGFRLGYAFCA